MKNYHPSEPKADPKEKELFKHLEWEVVQDSEDFTKLEAKHPFGYYSVYRISNSDGSFGDIGPYHYEWSINEYGGQKEYDKPMKSWEEAKQRAQDDFNSKLKLLPKYRIMKHPTDEEIEKELNRQLRSWDTHVGISAGEAYINGFKACAKWARDQQPKLKPIEDEIPDAEEEAKIEAHIKWLGPSDPGQFSLGFTHGRKWERDKQIKASNSPKPTTNEG